MAIRFSNKDIENTHKQVLESTSYGKETRLIDGVLNRFSKNTDINEVACKIALIDVTNSTNLSRHRSKINMYDLAEFITKIERFDERVKAGDRSLVVEIAKNNGSINLLSFASKYCTYHNVHIYGRDDYSIFDTILKENLPRYIDGVSKYKLENMRREYDYDSYMDIIDKILEDNGIDIPMKRRMFDHYVWYNNR